MSLVNLLAGSIVPITGFANSITSPALEFKREGYIYGIELSLVIVDLYFFMAL